MGKLEEASARLQAAVERLDKVLSGSSDSMAAQVSSLSSALETTENERDSLKSDLAGLRTEHDKLHKALREAQENYAAMQVVNEAVAGRIDGAIGGLQRMLEKA